MPQLLEIIDNIAGIIFFIPLWVSIHLISHVGEVITIYVIAPFPVILVGYLRYFHRYKDSKNRPPRYVFAIALSVSVIMFLAAFSSAMVMGMWG